MDSKNLLKMGVLLLGSIGGWILAAQHWPDLLATNSIGGLLVNLGVVVGASFGVSTTKPTP